MNRLASHPAPAHHRWLRLGRAALCGFLFLVGAVSCTRSNLKADLDRGSLGDDDLVALLPRGLDAILDVDVAGLRKLGSAGELLAFLPERTLSRLEVLCDDPLQNIDSLALAILGMGTAAPEVIVVARGRLQQPRVFAGMRKIAAGPLSEAEYHGLPIIEFSSEVSGDAAADEPKLAPAEAAAAAVATKPGSDKNGLAAAMLNSRAAVYGNRLTVRQVIDIFRRDEEGARSQVELMQALERAPHARVGRPAVMLAMLLTLPLRDRLRQIGSFDLGTDAEQLSAALAVGDGIDLGLVVGYRELATAQDASRRLLERTRELQQRPALRFIGIERYLKPLLAVAAPANRERKFAELHLAYRLPGDELSELVSRVGKLLKLRQRLSGGDK